MGGTAVVSASDITFAADIRSSFFRKAERHIYDLLRDSARKHKLERHSTP
jgi:hypothetical protein